MKSEKPESTIQKILKLQAAGGILLLAASAGYNDTGLSLLDIKSRRVTQLLQGPARSRFAALSRRGSSNRAITRPMVGARETCCREPLP